MIPVWIDDLLFVGFVVAICSVPVYYAIHPTGYEECELEANKLGVEFVYNSFDGCKLHREGGE